MYLRNKLCKDTYFFFLKIFIIKCKNMVKPKIKLESGNHYKNGPNGHRGIYVQADDKTFRPNRNG